MSNKRKADLLRALMGEAKAPKKDQPGLMDDAARLAEAGRYGDKIVAHINPEEAALLKARGGSGTVNPRTGLLEFYDSSFDGGGAGNQDAGFGTDPSGGAPGGNMGGGGTTPGEQLADALGRGDRVDFSVAAQDSNQVDPWAGTLGGKIGDKAMPSFNENRGFFDRLGDNVRANFNDMAARPGETIANLVAGAVIPGYSLANMAVGFAAPGQTLAGLGIDAAKGGVPSEYMGSEESTSPGGSKDSPLGNDSRGGGGNASGSGGPLSQQQSALAQALMGNTPLNQGRKTFGSLVESFDPNGRRYVTPWAYRG